MADEISDERFKSEMMGSMHNVIGRFSDIDHRFDSIDQQLASIKSDVNVLSGQLNDVGVMAIKDSGRIDDHEKRISDLEANIH